MDRYIIKQLKVGLLNLLLNWIENGWNVTVVWWDVICLDGRLVVHGVCN